MKREGQGVEQDVCRARPLRGPSSMMGTNVALTTVLFKLFGGGGSLLPSQDIFDNAHGTLFHQLKN